MIKNHPGAYGVLAGLLVLLLGLVANAGCQKPHVPNALEKYEASLPRRTPMQRAASAVEIYTECGSGTGVLISPTLVLTANHVVDCGSGNTSEPAQYIGIRTADKKSSIAVVDVADPQRDLARLKLSTPIDGVSMVTIRFALTGERICASTAVPERAIRCGVTGGFEKPREYGDVTVRDINVWYGNSGSGVYSKDGMLVGIAVRLNWCDPADALIYALTGERVDTCGGRVSSINDSPVMP